jgi:preprotein translocase subunit SecF
MATILDIGSLTPHQLFYELFLPFIIILVIFFGVLQMTRIFKQRKINLILSLAITALVSATPAFNIISTTLARYAGWTAIAAFFLVFIFGIITWGVRRGVEYGRGTLVEVERLRKDIRKLQERLSREGNPDMRMQLAREIEEKKRLRDSLSAYT